MEFPHPAQVKRSKPHRTSLSTSKDTSRPLYIRFLPKSPGVELLLILQGPGKMAQPLSCFRAPPSESGLCGVLSPCTTFLEPAAHNGLHTRHGKAREAGRGREGPAQLGGLHRGNGLSAHGGALFLKPSSVGSKL